MADVRYSLESNRAVLMVKTKNTLPLIAISKSESMIEFPVVIKNGTAVVNIVTSGKKLKVLDAIMRFLGTAYELKEVTAYKEKEGMLTDRQREILRLAIKHGYYEIPRRITLEELAREVGISKSSLAEILRRIERKLLTYGDT